ncbi:hypothetical protein L228DRAFT_265402 [Xylona heveae TC161]|uniref:Uncharacterized protein n=1 Tax=Xylona heveae (strain CBS 132557 / TC161) TaxID=1328760 RepID=A0A165IH68_XYLHT|nr:hypothetical protein L228DRAFT_265402 [Xylona heveae TC161]KZF24891.1 hypothetical protein L228DRAFT_265402 [Xylona heveae TC161]
MIQKLLTRPSNTTTSLPGLGSLLLGYFITPKADGGAHDTSPLAEAWGLKTGVYTPQQLVEGFAPLLDTVVYRLGKDPPDSKPARVRLLDNLAANLATDTREATLRLSEPLDPSRWEMLEQAKRIGESLVQWARESSAKSFDPDMYLRSPCEGHLLIPPNVDLMFGYRSQPHLMQLFNEYMHQMVLLRDALLPFKNYQDVLIPLDGKAARGIRHLEQARAQFLAELMTKHTTQSAIIKYAKALLAPGLLRTSTVGYGFQYPQGSVLPAFLSGGPTPLHLLQYVPVKFDETSSEVLFDYQFQDYYSAPHLEIPSGVATAELDQQNLSAAQLTEISRVHSSSVGLVPSSHAQSIRQLQLRLGFDDGKRTVVDLGQIARGHRYSYMALESSAADPVGGHGSSERDLNDTSTQLKSTVVHDAAAVLEKSEKGLLTAKAGGIHVIPTVDPIVSLALLGKLYPENVILLPQDEGLNLAQRAGKGFEPKFVIWGGVKWGGLKGVF